MKDFEPLFEALQNKKLPLYGCFSVWGDEIGRPGDNVYQISNIEVDTNVISIKVVGEIFIEIYNPAILLLTEHGFKIKNADKVQLLGKNINLSYQFQQGKIHAVSLEGAKTFRTDINKAAFEYYSW